MGQFLTKLQCEVLPNRIETIQLTGRLVFLADDGRIIDAPIGFISNGVSVPTLFWPLSSPLGVNARAGVGHDLLYSTQCIKMLADPSFDPLVGPWIEVPINQHEADNYFYEMGKACGFRSGWNWIEWSQLRMWGFVAWNRCRRELEDKQSQGHTILPT
jgi:hypothetical protein